MALSHLWNNPFRKVVVNDFVNKMQAFQKGEGTIKDVKENFINCIEGLKDLKPLAQSVSGLTDERQIQSALFDIRGAMMTDERQARNVSFD